MSDYPMIGVYMSRNGPITIHRDMSKDDMWMVLEWALKEIESQKSAFRSYRDMEKSFREAEKRLFR